MDDFVAEASAVSEAPPAGVWARLINGRRWYEWNPGVRWMMIEGPVRPGSFLTIQPERGRGRQTAFTIEEAVENEHFVYATTFGPLAKMTIEYRIAPLNDGSRIEARVVVGGLMKKIVARVIARKYMENLAENVVALAKDAAHTSRV
jgi:carbon monoxide dehydrogenase subunit G